jgi:hypothetical protein
MLKPKLLILIPDGTGIKNYLLSDFLVIASVSFEIILAHNFNTSIHSEINISKDKFQHIHIPKYKEKLKHKFIRESLCYARLKYNSKIKSNPSIMVNWRRDFKQFTKAFFYKLVEKYGSYLSKDYKRIKKLTNYYHHNIEQSNSIIDFLSLLKSLSPDLVFSTHQRALYNIPLFAAARKLEIPSVSVIYSWDNMPKARIPYYSNFFFAWSKYMKNEFGDYYPDIDSNNVIITGTPQFEFYLENTLIESKSDFFSKHKLDPTKPLICYSGDDKLTSPFDADYLRDMALAFSKIEKQFRPQIILRPSPVDDGKRFESVLNQYPDICYAPADWFEDKDDKNWMVKFPKQNDIKALINLAYHADAVVNLGSTMAHDFAMFEKPAFYVNYMPNPSIASLEMPYAKNWSVKTIYQYEHFKSMEGLEPVYWINNEKEFEIIPKLITQKKPRKLRDQKIWRDKIIGKNLYKNASQKLVEELVKLT